MAQFNLPATEPSLDGIQNALGLSGVTNYAELIVPQDFGWAPPKFWAKWQPMHLNRLHKLTDEERRANAYGLKVFTDNYGVFNLNNSHHRTTAFNMAESRQWILQRNYPTGDINVSPYRPWDYFNEAGTESYNKDAVSPFFFDVEEITNQGYVQASAYALKADELPDAGAGCITLDDMKSLAGDSIVTDRENTCFGLLYTKDGGSVQVLGANGEYQAFLEGNQGERTSDMKLVGNGTYKFVFILLNKSTKNFITIPPYSTYEAVVTSTDVPSGLLLVEGLYYFNTSGTIMTIAGLTLTPQNAPAVAGNLAIYICPIGTKEEKVESAAIYTTSKSYGDIAQGSSYTFPDFTINVSDYDINNIEVWVTTTTSSGVYKRQLEWYDNSGDIA